MKIETWHEGMSDREGYLLAYWERNVLALKYAEGWYNDDIPQHGPLSRGAWQPRYTGWRRVLSLEGGSITFHVPDDFEVGNLPEIAPNWDGHTTEEKWRRILAERELGGEGLSPDLDRANVEADRDALKADYDVIKYALARNVEREDILKAEVSTLEARMIEDRLINSQLHARACELQEEVQRLTNPKRDELRAENARLQEEVRRLNLVLTGRPPLKDLNAEVAQLREQLEDYRDTGAVFQQERNEARAEVARLREALERIANFGAKYPVSIAIDCARSALAAAGKETT